MISYLSLRQKLFERGHRGRWRGCAVVLWGALTRRRWITGKITTDFRWKSTQRTLVRWETRPRGVFTHRDLAGGDGTTVPRRTLTHGGGLIDGHMGDCYVGYAPATHTVGCKSPEVESYRESGSSLGCSFQLSARQNSVPTTKKFVKKWGVKFGSGVHIAPKIFEWYEWEVKLAPWTRITKRVDSTS